jgi:hypothetical protein
MCNTQTGYQTLRLIFVTRRFVNLTDCGLAREAGSRLDGNLQVFSVMFEPCTVRLLEETNNMHRLYHSFILRIGSYMFRQ